MTDSGIPGLLDYITSVDGYATDVPCVQSAYSAALAYAWTTVNNCQVSNAAAVYGACLCTKAANIIEKRITASIYTVFKCADDDKDEALNLWSGFCASAQDLAAQITGDGPTNTDPVPTTSRATHTTTLVDPTTTPHSSTSNHSTPLSTGAIAGIVVAGIVCLVAVLGFIVWKIRTRDARQPTVKSNTYDNRNSVLNAGPNNPVPGYNNLNQSHVISSGSNMSHGPQYAPSSTNQTNMSNITGSTFYDDYNNIANWNNAHHGSNYAQSGVELETMSNSSGMTNPKDNVPGRSHIGHGPHYAPSSANQSVPSSNGRQSVLSSGSLPRHPVPGLSPQLPPRIYPYNRN